jgi:carotenoid cleavage dioxygenase-like enzyme
LRYDLKSGETAYHDFGESRTPSEFVFVPAPEAQGEDEGWLIGFVYDRTRNASDLVIFDAQRVSGKTLAEIELPKRVPQGFHGAWIADEAVS